MRLLALDLGTKTGWALHDQGTVTSGTWVLATPKEVKTLRAQGLDRCCDFRTSRLRQHLHNVDPHVIVFEDVQFATSLLQVQLWSSLRAMVWLESATRKVVAVDVGTLKKFATGNGKADKEHMAQAAHKAGFGGGSVERFMDADDNEIDAWWLLQHELKNGTNL